MGSLSLNITGGSSPYTVSVKKVGDTTERFQSFTSGVVTFVTDLGSNEYTITVTKSGCSSASETFSLTCTSITEPSFGEYYFSDGNAPSYYDNTANLPDIFAASTNYNPTTELVWLENDILKVGINLKAGGQLTYISRASSSVNLVNNGPDKGRQIQIDTYQDPPVYTQGGETAGALDPNAPSSYNATMGGDYQGNTMSLIDYHPVTNGYYIKIRPLIWGLTGKLSQLYIEATYTLLDNYVKIDYVYTSYRTDGQYTSGSFNSAAVPAMFISANLNKYKYYDGSNPFTNDTVTQGTLPIQNQGESIIFTNPTEYWTMVYRDSDATNGVGLYNPNGTDFQLKQLEVYPGDPTYTEFSNGFTYMNSGEFFDIVDRSNYTKSMTAYILIGSESEIRNKVYELHSI